LTTAIEQLAGIGDWRMPIPGREIVLSATACRLLGVEGAPPATLEELIGLCHPEDQTLLREACDRLLSSSGTGRFELDVRMPVAGRLAWFRHCAQIDRGPAGDAPTLIGVLQDVSWHQQALQDATAQLKAQVQTERDRLKAAASAGIVGVWDWDIPRDVLVWDEVMYRLYGLKPEDFGGAYEAWTSAVHPDDRAGAEAAIAAALRGEHDYEYVFRVIWPSDGSTHYIKAAASTVFDENGKALRMVGVNHEVTEQIAREQALKEAIRAALEANAAKSEFLARMSHEIRTPMNAVIGLSAMGMELPDLPLRAAEYMKRIHQSSAALMSLLNDILDFSKIEARQIDLTPEEFELEALINASTDLFALAAHQNGLQLVTNIDQDLPKFLVGDAIKLGQILNNLLGNAIKFTPSGQIMLSARRLPTSHDREARFVRLQFSVQDTGIGIAPKSVGDLFLPFSQANGSISRRYGGSGLGLSISQRLCELMGGHIQVTSKPGVGSTFSFELELPIADTQVGSTVGSQLLYHRVLVVDDVAQERQVIVDLLERWHVDVVQACGGHEAIEWLSRSFGTAGQPFDLVLLDWDMPEVGGREVARRILELTAENAQRRAPVMLIMAAVSDRERVTREVEDLKFVKLLLKPITASRLLSALSAAPGASSPPVAGPTPQMQRLRAAPIAGAHVLLVEDTADSQLVATDMLEGLGLRVTVATNGQQALELLQQTSVDVILMDVHMPVMDGLQATRLIRKREELAHVPVLAMTAAALAQESADCAAAGMAEIITKPIDTETLLSALLRWVKHRESATVTPTETAQAAAPAVALKEAFPEIAGIDSADASRRLMGDATLFHAVLATASTGLESTLQAAVAAVQQGHRAEAANLIHALRGSLGNLGAREAWALAARSESGLRSTEPPAPTADLQELERAVTALASAIRQHLTSHPLAAPHSPQQAPGDQTTPAAPFAAALASLLALLDVHDIKALEYWHALEPAIETRMGLGFCDRLRAAMTALDFTEAAKLLRPLDTAA
jgi:PAS domain S-box-containing protein